MHDGPTRLPKMQLGKRTFTTAAGTLTVQTDLKASEYGDVWQAGHTLACFLEAEPIWVKGKKVLELGAGVGYVGLACSMLGASEVVLTDLEPLLPVLRMNAQDNVDVSPHTVVRLLDWGIKAQRNAISALCFDVVVASDVIYEEQNVEPLIACLEAVWEASAAASVQVHFLLALKKRALASSILDNFFVRVEEKGFRNVEVKPQGDSSRNLRQIRVDEPAYWKMCVEQEVSLHCISKDLIQGNDDCIR